MYKSNIDIASNIYICDSKSASVGIDMLRDDPKLAAQITGYKALSIVKEKYKDVRLSLLQEDELRNSIPCKYAAKGEITHGRVLKDGILKYECRCESIDCKYVDKCKPNKPNREKISKHELDTVQNPLGFERLGISAETDPFSFSIAENERLNLDTESISEALKKIPVSFIKAEKFNRDNLDSAAILCRNDGEAEYMSWLLHKNHVSHSLIRTNEHPPSIHRCIAEALWDYANDEVSKEDFLNRLTVRSDFSKQNAESVYNAICIYLYGEYNEYFEYDKFTFELCRNTDIIPKEILNNVNCSLIVSSVHSSKNKKFDKVYFLEYDYKSESKNTAEEVQMIHTAQNCAKREIEILSKKNKNDWYFKNNGNKWIRIAKKSPYKRDMMCVGYTVGVSEDYDYASFVEGGLMDAVKRQAYISANVKAENKISLKLNGNIYEIIHKNNVIGKMSSDFSKRLIGEFGDGKSYLSKLPPVINGLFVDNVITYAADRDYDNTPDLYRKNRMWLAVEISGFGQIKWA